MKTRKDNNWSKLNSTELFIYLCDISTGPKFHFKTNTNKEAKENTYTETDITKKLV
jgi:hypothetical protein